MPGSALPRKQGSSKRYFQSLFHKGPTTNSGLVRLCACFRCELVLTRISHKPNRKHIKHM